MAYSRDEQAAFEAAQHEDTFLAWVEMNDYILEYEIDGDIPGLPPKPWGAEALRVAERRALEAIPEQRNTFDSEHQDLSWKLVRMLGQTFVEAFGGRWVNVPSGDGIQADIAVELPFREFYLEPRSLLTAAMKRRTGEEWARVFQYAEEDHAQYLTTTTTSRDGHGEK